MSSGRYTMRGWATQGLAFAGLALAGRDAVVVSPLNSVRYQLIGATGQRFGLDGASSARVNLIGSTSKRFELEGSAR